LFVLPDNRVTLSLCCLLPDNVTVIVYVPLADV
jgi:hypothetical protein